MNLRAVIDLGGWAILTLLFYKGGPKSQFPLLIYKNTLPLPLTLCHNVPQNFHLNLILKAILDPDGNRTVLSCALLDADFSPLARNQHPARLLERTLN